MRLIERVDQRDETLGLVVIRLRQAGHTVQKQHIDDLCQRQIIRRTQGLAAQIPETGPRDAPDMLRQFDLAALDLQNQRHRRLATRLGLPQPVHLLARLTVGGREPDLPALDPVLPVIGLAGQFHHLHPLADQRDEGQEKLPVQAVLVQILGHPVRGGDDGHALLEQDLEQTTHDHRIGDIGDLHFVETQQPHLLGHGQRHRAHRILLAAFAHLLQRVLDFLHELVEMHPALLRQRCRLKDQVHQHRLATPDTAPQV